MIIFDDLTHFDEIIKMIDNNEIVPLDVFHDYIEYFCNHITGLDAYELMNGNI